MSRGANPAAGSFRVTSGPGDLASLTARHVTHSRLTNFRTQRLFWESELVVCRFWRRDWGAPVVRADEPGPASLFPATQHNHTPVRIEKWVLSAALRESCVDPPIFLSTFTVEGTAGNLDGWQPGRTS